MLNEKTFKARVSGLARSGATIRKNGQELAIDAVLWAQHNPTNAPCRAHTLITGLQSQPKIFHAMKAYLGACGFRIVVEKEKIRVSVSKEGAKLPEYTWMDTAPRNESARKEFNLEKFLQGAAKRGGVEVAILQSYIRTNEFKNAVAKMSAKEAKPA